MALSDVAEATGNTSYDPFASAKPTGRTSYDPFGSEKLIDQLPGAFWMVRK